MTTYKPREITKVLVEASANMPVVVLSGMRQTGKSTLLEQLSKASGRRYVSFDDFGTLAAARLNPERFLSGDHALAIDEAQKFPEILTIIKREVDKHRRPGRFILSGSANFLLLKNISESLAGRAVYLPLYPFSRREMLDMTGEEPALIFFIKHGSFPKRNVKAIQWEDIAKGGMPSICLGEVSQPAVWFRGYEQTYLERDIRSLSQVADLVSFRHLLQLAALRNAQVLKQSELARDAKLNAMTTNRYLSLMETSFIIFRLFPHLRNRSSRLIKSPKLYLSDSGVAGYLAGIKKLNGAEPLGGALLESYAAQNLLSIFSAHLPEANITYWNIQGRYEVDFIVELGRETIAIEVKNGARWQENDLAGIKAYLASETSCRAGLLAYGGNDVLQLENNIWLVPAALLLS
jgi:predicted AAA+ superfamily ATPase